MRHLVCRPRPRCQGLIFQQPIQKPFRRLWNHRAWGEYLRRTCLQNGFVILRGYDAAGNDQDVMSPALVQRFLEFRDQREMSGREG